MDKTFLQAADVRASQHAASSPQPDQDVQLLRRLKNENKELGQTQELLLQEHQHLAEKLTRMADTLQRMKYSDAMESKLNITAQNLNRYCLLTQAKSRNSKQSSPRKQKKRHRRANRQPCASNSSPRAWKTRNSKRCRPTRN